MVRTSSPPPPLPAGAEHAVRDSAIDAAAAAARKRVFFIAFLSWLRWMPGFWGAGRGRRSVVAPDDQRDEPSSVRRSGDFFTDHAAPAHDDRAVGDLHHVIHRV